jgi:hypothetical protein
MVLLNSLWSYFCHLGNRKNEVAKMLGLFMKKLAVDTSAEEIRRTTTILEKNKIKYEIRTTRTRGSIGSAMDAQTYANANLAMYKGASPPSFIYTVYVKPKDYDRARKLVKGSSS